MLVRAELSHSGHQLKYVVSNVSGESPTAWTCDEEDPFRPHRFPRLEHLRMDHIQLGYPAIIGLMSQLHSLRSLCLIAPFMIGGLSDKTLEGLLTELTSLSLYPVSATSPLKTWKKFHC